MNHIEALKLIEKKPGVCVATTLESGTPVVYAVDLWLGHVLSYGGVAPGVWVRLGPPEMIKLPDREYTRIRNPRRRPYFFPGEK